VAKVPAPQLELSQQLTWQMSAQKSLTFKQWSAP
jgi:hypothetical protein